MDRVFMWTAFGTGSVSVTNPILARVYRRHPLSWDNGPHDDDWRSTCYARCPAKRDNQTNNGIVAFS